MCLEARFAALQQQPSQQSSQSIHTRPILFNAFSPSFSYKATSSTSPGYLPEHDSAARFEAARLLPFPQRLEAEKLAVRELTEWHSSASGGGYTVIASGPISKNYFTRGAPLCGVLEPEHTAVFKLQCQNEKEIPVVHALIFYAYGGLDELIDPLRSVGSRMLHDLDDKGNLRNPGKAFVVLWGRSEVTFLVWSRELGFQKA